MVLPPSLPLPRPRCHRPDALRGRARGVGMVDRDGLDGELMAVKRNPCSVCGTPIDQTKRAIQEHQVGKQCQATAAAQRTEPTKSSRALDPSPGATE